MKLDFGEDWEEKKRRLMKWHQYFAWHPVKVGSHDWRWLENVYRKGTQGTGGLTEGWVWHWHYSVNSKVLD